MSKPTKQHDSMKHPFDAAIEHLKVMDESFSKKYYQDAIRVLEAAKKVSGPEIMAWLAGQISTEQILSPVVTRSVAMNNKSMLEKIRPLIESLPDREEPRP